MNHRRPSYCPETSASKGSGLLGVDTRVFREAGRSRPQGAYSLAALSVGLMASGDKAQTVIIFPSGSIGVTGHITLTNPLVGGLIHLRLSQCGWAC
jgi:hypothetical protein